MIFYLFANRRPAVPFFYDGGAERTINFLGAGLARNGLFVVQLCTFPQNRIELAKENASAIHTSFVEETRYVVPELALDLCTTNPFLVVRDGERVIVAVDSCDYQDILRQIVDRGNPSLLVTWLAGSDSVVALGEEFGIPTILRVVGPDLEEGYPPLTGQTVVLANSPMSAQSCKSYYGRDVDYLYELIDHESYLCETRDSEFVTFINPRTEKGLHLFCKIASRALDTRFLAIEGWSRSNYTFDEARAISFLRSLPNVSVLPPMPDMRHVYRKTRVLLLPSRWPESWARVVGEAQANGIPVIASDRGSSPLQIGEGGVVIEYGAPNTWVAIVHLLLNDDKLSASMQKQAENNCQRFNAEKLLDAYSEFFSNVANGQEYTLELSTSSIRFYRGIIDDQGAPSLQAQERSMNHEIDLSEPDYP